MSYTALVIAGTLLAALAVMVGQYRWLGASDETYRLERLRAALILAGVFLASLLLLPVARDADRPPEPCCLRTLPS